MQTTCSCTTNEKNGGRHTWTRKREGGIPRQEKEREEVGENEGRKKERKEWVNGAGGQQKEEGSSS